MTTKAKMKHLNDPPLPASRGGPLPPPPKKNPQTQSAPSPFAAGDPPCRETAAANADIRSPRGPAPPAMTSNNSSPFRIVPERHLTALPSPAPSRVARANRHGASSKPRLHPQRGTARSPHPRHADLTPTPPQTESTYRHACGAGLVPTNIFCPNKFRFPIIDSSCDQTDNTAAAPPRLPSVYTAVYTKSRPRLPLGIIYLYRGSRKRKRERCYCILPILPQQCATAPVDARNQNEHSHRRNEPPAQRRRQPDDRHQASTTCTPPAAAARPIVARGPRRAPRPPGS